MILASLCTGILAIYVYQYLGWKWVAIPWLPMSLIGTATAFYVGFKNNQAYGRNWEARIIWGAITNSSRSFAATARAYINNDFTTQPVPQTEIDREIRTLIYRHIGWLHVLKYAMAQRTSWEHEDSASKRQRKALPKEKQSLEEQLTPYLSPEEIAWVKTRKNGATQLLDKQSQHLAQLTRAGLINTLRQIELQKIINDFYNEQGRSERIKNTPFPRQYATTSLIYIFIFIVLLPFGMIGEFVKLGETMLWLLIPFNLVVTWVFMLMEYTGDVSENPFEGLLNDVPLRSIVRNIEIDLRDMLGEDNLPERAQAKFGILM
ncbi:bestrophin family protein [Runella sp.]|uniref:bestrophin family protein n=1 Tax=Runella sp. TaxID=1960881 RepID=UPI003D0BA911